MIIRCSRFQDLHSKSIFVNLRIVRFSGGVTVFGVEWSPTMVAVIGRSSQGLSSCELCAVPYSCLRLQTSTEVWLPNTPLEHALAVMLITSHFSLPQAFREVGLASK